MTVTQYQRAVALTAALVATVALLPASARADALVDLSGPSSNAGSIDLTTESLPLSTINGITGYSLWSLLGNVTTTTPSGDNSKNAILRYYLVATATNGAQSLVSLGEIDTTFGGTAIPALVTVSGNTASLAFTGSAAAAERDIGDLASLQIYSAPALPALPVSVTASQSTSVVLSGNVSYPGSYIFTGSDPQNLPPITETVSGATYTGVGLFDLIAPSDSDILDQYVVTAGTDGYEVVLSLAELDPAFGASTVNGGIDLVPYDGTGFPAAGIARTILPRDNAHGRWESNLDLIEVAAVPEPGTVALLLTGLVGMTLMTRRHRAG